MIANAGRWRKAHVAAVWRLGLCWFLATALGLVLTSTANAQTLEGSAARLSSLLASHIDCSRTDGALVGIFPFEEATLPLSEQNAFLLYEIFLGTVIERAPACVRFVDGRGAFVTLDYLGKSGNLRESGQQQLAQIQSSLASADYTLDGTVMESAGEFEAVFRLTALKTGQAIGRVSFPVPERFRAAACGDGALPIDSAVRQMAETLLQRNGRIELVTATGGRYAQTDIVTDAGSFLEDGLLAELSRLSENVITDAALRIRRDPAGDATPEAGSYTLFLRYWVCEGDRSAKLSATLRSPDGQDITEARSISLSTLPAGLPLRPMTNPERSGDLSVSPLMATVGTELSLLAGPPAYCNPFFFNIAPSGRVTPIPLEYFRRLDIGGGNIRYEISPASEFGLAVQEDDEVGLNHLGYLCQPEEVRDMSDLKRLIGELLKARGSSIEGLLDLAGMSISYYRIAGFDIVK
jgi:hypothetical protein